MHINKHQGTRATAWVGAVLAVAIGLCAPAAGEPVMHPDGAQPPTGTVVALPGLSAVDASAPDASDDDDGGMQPVIGALSAHRPPGRATDWRAVSSPQTDRAPVGMGGHPVASSASSGLALDGSEDAQWRRELAETVLDVVLPAYEGLAATGILQAVRSLESELGLNNGHSFDDRPSGVHAHNTGDSAQPQLMGWSGPGDRIDTLLHLRSGAQVAEDQRIAVLRVKELVEDAKLWALILVALYGLGFLVKLALDYRRVKAARRRHRSPMISRRRRHRHHKRRPPV